MSLAALKAEIERKRKLADELKGGQPSKYVKRGDIEKALAKEQQDKKKSSVLSPTPTSPTPSAEEIKANEAVNENPDQIPPIAKDQLTRRLRERHQPVMLFGESDWQRWQRLRKMEEKEPMEYIQGMDNEFGREMQELDEHDDHDLDNDDLFKDHKQDGEGDGTNKEVCKEDFILSLFKKLLGEWEQELNDRPDSVKRTAQGKVDTVTYKQGRKHIKPLFKSLRDRTLPRDILDAIREICKFIINREYIRANDSYLRMAIGNSPWPMGVTMVGIHERSAREKIFTNQVAHVLNDETQRKYIQAIKRIMTWAQHKYPNLPSKCVG